MSIRIYLGIWLAFLLFLAIEYTALNGFHAHSFLLAMEAKGLIKFKVSPEPGRTLSLWLGYVGLSLMVVMNAYSARKRLEFLKGYGKLATWLNFHVFCGLLGPTFILFHSNFKVRGLVSIAFWSMAISFASGLIGRYFYLQIVMAKNESTTEGDKWARRLRTFVEKHRVRWDDGAYRPYMNNALIVAGLSPTPTSSFATFGRAVVGDLRLRFQNLPVPPEWPEHSEIPLKEFAVARRRAETLGAFQKLMGYWHAFHFPFAVFMYLAATIHVAASLIFAHTPQ